LISRHFFEGDIAVVDKSKSLSELSWFGPSWQQRTALSSLLPVGLGGEENQKKMAKLVGLDKDSLTETAKQANSNNNNTDKNIQKQGNTQSNSLSLPEDERAPEERLTFPQPAPPLSTDHDGTPFCLVSLGHPPGCVTSWLFVKINPVMAELRTEFSV